MTDKSQPWRLESMVLVCRALLRAPTIVNDVLTEGAHVGRTTWQGRKWERLGQ